MQRDDHITNIKNKKQPAQIDSPPSAVVAAGGVTACGIKKLSSTFDHFGAPYLPCVAM